MAAWVLDQAQASSWKIDVLGWRDHATKLLEKIENVEEVSEDLISLSESAFFISYLDVGMFMIQKLKKFI